MANGISTQDSDVTISMVMIGKNEESNIERCFDSFWDEVDEVVFCDTGSTDQTVSLVKKYAHERNESDKLIVGHYEWQDDFAAARSYADSLATCEWRSWIDLDDTVSGISNLRKIASTVNPDIVMLYVRYEYARDTLGNCFCELWRERLVRAAAETEWVGRVHECQVGKGNGVRVDKADACWTHHRNVAEVTDRNEKLLRRWNEEEPHNARVVSYLAFELMGARMDDGVDETGRPVSAPDLDKVKESIPYFQEYLQMPNEAPDSRAQAARRLSQVLMTLGHWAEAQTVALTAFSEVPWFPDTLLTLAEIAHEQQDWQRTIEFSKQVLEHGEPDTMLIINPEDYTLRPKTLQASSLAALGKMEDAVRIAKEVVDVNPNYMNMSVQLAEWAGILARDQAGNMWANSAQLLLLNDEPEKAAVLLDTAPYFSTEHSAVVAMRIRVSEALNEPYQLEPLTDGARAQFLARCLREQEKEMAALTPVSEENPIDLQEVAA